MLRFFRLNDPYRLLGLLLLMGVIGAAHLFQMPALLVEELRHMVIGESVGNNFLYVELIDDVSPLMAMADRGLDIIMGRSQGMRHLLAMLILFLEASYFAMTLIRNRAFNESSYVPALIFGLLAFFSFDLMTVSPELLGSFFLLLSLDNLFREIEFRVDKDALVLNLGIFLGIASLFVFSYTVFLFGTVVLLVLFARATFRKILLLLFGYAIVHGFVITLYYSYNQLGDLWNHFYAPQLVASGAAGMDAMSVFRMLLLPLVYFVISLFMLTREARLTRYQTQLFQAIFLWLVIASVQIWISDAWSTGQFITILPPLTYFISHYLLLIRRRWIAEGMTLLLLAGVIFLHYGGLNNRVPGVHFTPLFVEARKDSWQQEKILLLDDDVSVYQDNRLAAGFFNWKLSRRFFEQSDDFGHLIRIRTAILRDPPDRILDPHRIMAGAMQRLPELREMYVEEGTGYRRR